MGELFTHKAHIREATWKYANVSIEIGKGKGERFPLEH